MQEAVLEQDKEDAKQEVEGQAGEPEGEQTEGDGGKESPPPPARPMTEIEFFRKLFFRK